MLVEYFNTDGRSRKIDRIIFRTVFEHIVKQERLDVEKTHGTSADNVLNARPMLKTCLKMLATCDDLYKMKKIQSLFSRTP